MTKGFDLLRDFIFVDLEVFLAKSGDGAPLWSLTVACKTTKSTFVRIAYGPTGRLWGALRTGDARKNDQKEERKQPAFLNRALFHKLFRISLWFSGHLRESERESDPDPTAHEDRSTSPAPSTIRHFP